MMLLPLLVALILMGIILSSLGKDAGAALERFLSGALGTPNARVDVIMLAVPMLLCASGLLLTYTAGLWNIGVEGQVTMGAIFATIIARSITQDDTSPLIVPAELLLAAVGGALWAALAALLRIHAKVNEIFGGVALNFISVNILLWLLNGDWKVGTYPQTADFNAPALLPRLEGTRFSPLGIGLALGAWLLVFWALNHGGKKLVIPGLNRVPVVGPILALGVRLLNFLAPRGTRWGLQLRAIGRSPRSASLLGVRVNRHILLSMIACGALAGITGAVQAIFVRGRLSPGISGGIGFMGVLIVLLVNIRPLWVPLIALFFALVPIGSLKLASSLDPAVQIDASLGNVFQGVLVLGVLLANGLRERAARNRKENIP